MDHVRYKAHIRLLEENRGDNRRELRLSKYFSRKIQRADYERKQL